MNQLNTFHELVALDGDQVMTDSRTVAKTFDRPYKNVLHAYDHLTCSRNFNERNFPH